MILQDRRSIASLVVFASGYSCRAVFVGVSHNSAISYVQCASVYAKEACQSSIALILEAQQLFLLT